MKTTELFSGSKSFSKVAANLGHATFTVDNEAKFSPDLVADVMTLKASDLPEADFIWASPPCTAFSVASIGHHWTGGRRAYVPKTDGARLGKALVEKTIAIIREKNPRHFVIENPRGLLRKMPFMEGMNRVTITYCAYGDRRMKATDLWHNIPGWTPRPMCRNGSPCHEAAPRGAKTGTQGLKGAAERGRIPPALFEEIFAAIDLTPPPLAGRGER